MQYPYARSLKIAHRWFGYPFSENPTLYAILAFKVTPK